MNKFYKALAATAALAGCIKKEEPVYTPRPEQTQNYVSRPITNIVLENGDIIVLPYQLDDKKDSVIHEGETVKKR